MAFSLNFKDLPPEEKLLFWGEFLSQASDLTSERRIYKIGGDFCWKESQSHWGLIPLSLTEIFNMTLEFAKEGQKTDSLLNALTHLKKRCCAHYYDGILGRIRYYISRVFPFFNFENTEAAKQFNSVLEVCEKLPEQKAETAASWQTFRDYRNYYKRIAPPFELTLSKKIESQVAFFKARILEAWDLKPAKASKLSLEDIPESLKPDFLAKTAAQDSRLKQAEHLRQEIETALPPSDSSKQETRFSISHLLHTLPKNSNDLEQLLSQVTHRRAHIFIFSPKTIDSFKIILKNLIQFDFLYFPNISFKSAFELLESLRELSSKKNQLPLLKLQLSETDPEKFKNIIREIEELAETLGKPNVAFKLVINGEVYPKVEGGASNQGSSGVICKGAAPIKVSPPVELDKKLAKRIREKMLSIDQNTLVAMQALENFLDKYDQTADQPWKSETNRFKRFAWLECLIEDLLPQLHVALEEVPQRLQKFYSELGLET
jgi:hypothetical protein